MREVCRDVSVSGFTLMNPSHLSGAFVRRTWSGFLQWVLDDLVETTHDPFSLRASAERASESGRRMCGAAEVAVSRHVRTTRTETSDGVAPSDESLLAGMSTRDEDSMIMSYVGISAESSDWPSGSFTIRAPRKTSRKR